MTPDQMRSRTKTFMGRRPTRDLRGEFGGMGDRIRGDVQSRIGSQWQDIFKRYGVQMNNPLDFFNPDTRRSLMGQLASQLRAKAQTVPGQAFKQVTQQTSPGLQERTITRPGVATRPFEPDARLKLVEAWRNRGR